MEFSSLKQLDFTPRGAVYPSPTDWREQFIYFLLIDRFNNGSLDTPPYDPATATRDRSNDYDFGTRPQGGNLRGITHRLDYIKNLGTTAIWISPVLKYRADNPHDYHGYAPQNFLEIDPHFGTLRDLQELVRQAHARDMVVIVDIVINHTGDVWQYAGNQGYAFNAGGPWDFGHWNKVSDGEGLGEDDAIWPVEFQNPDWFKRRGAIDNWYDPYQATNGDFMSLKTLDHGREDVVSALIDVYKYWMAVADFDAYRIDAVKHIEDTSVAIFCNAIREYALSIGKENFFIFGEIVGGDDVIDRYLGRKLVGGPTEGLKSLDACLDFPQYFILEDVLKGMMHPNALIERFERLSTSYHDHGESSYYFVSFVDNHDQMARPFRRFLNNDPYQDQAVLAIGYLLTAKGIPCIYYGTEQGFDGGGESDCFIRECMFGGQWGAFGTTGCHFFDEQHPIYRAIKRIADIRAAEPTLKFGRMYFREISGDGENFGRPWGPQTTLAYSRVLSDDEMIMALNLTIEPREDWVLTDSKFNQSGTVMVDLLNRRELPVEAWGQGSKIRVPLGPHQMAIIKCCRTPDETSELPVTPPENP
ncbi:MAG: alpha-amylase family glycosyl hydrolase [Bacteroidota bacterium]